MADGPIREIERALDRDRAELAQSLAALCDRMRPSALMDEGKAAVRARTGPVLAELDRLVRARPVMAALYGVTLAGLLAGRRAEDGAETTPALAGTRFEALARWEDEGGPPAPEPVDPDEDWLTEALGLRARAREHLARIDDAARRGLAPAADLARHRAEVIAALGAETRTVLDRGLEALEATARQTALQARERVYLARVALEEKVEAQPLMAGAVAALAGAGLAWVLPPTDTEDRLMGPARDRLLRDIGQAAWRRAAEASDLAQPLQSDAGRIVAFFAGRGRVTGGA